MNPISSNDFPQVYEDLGIDTGRMGCIMLNMATVTVTDIIKEEDLYSSDDPESFTEGAVSEQEPHVTLLYGLMRSGLELRKHVDAVLEDWSLPVALTIESVGFFYGKPDEPSIAIVAHMRVDTELQEGNDRLKLLPHINTFPGYKPHMTLAYVKESADYNEYIRLLGERLNGTRVAVTGINYGK